MSTKTGQRNSLGPEELALRSIRARRRFKALVRKVIANWYWLHEEESEYTSKNIKKYMQTHARKKSMKGLLSLQQKSILYKPAEDRTETEKHLLYRIIGGLKCFRKYPEKVKMQLAGVTYFVFFPAGRVIVRQKQEAHALFFIISGELAVSIITTDLVLREEVTIHVGTMVAGSMFGEVSLLHDIPRTATITTLTPCEFLCVKKADFDIVLKTSVSREWAEIQKSMMRFEYFKGWDELSIRECCLYSKIKSYSHDQVILGDGIGCSSTCYFILKGQCRIIEHLLMAVTYDEHGKKRYALRDSKTSEADEKIILDERKHSAESFHSSPTTSAFNKLISSEVKTVKSYKLTGEKSNTSELRRKKELFQKTDTLESKNSLLPSTNTETHFMQVCILSETACFGVGENFNRRRVTAMSDNVECLLVPRYWLTHRSRGNIWTRIKQYLNQKIPTTEEVFREFLTQRKWNDYKKKMFHGLIKKPPQNTHYNIPYSIRINEIVEFE